VKKSDTNSRSRIAGNNAVSRRTFTRGLLAAGITAAINWRFQRDFSREWAESLRVKHPAPLGEEALARMTARRR
jgi:hypothetical protein